MIAINAIAVTDIPADNAISEDDSATSASSDGGIVPDSLVSVVGPGRLVAPDRKA
jgi:hypothetical protein